MKLPNQVNSMDIYHELIQQDIGVTPSQLFNIVEAQQHFIRLNCSFEWSESIQNALDTLIRTIQIKMTQYRFE